MSVLFLCLEHLHKDYYRSVLIWDQFSETLYYRIYPKYSDRQASANSVDPDQTPHNAASDQGLRCLILI